MGSLKDHAQGQGQPNNTSTNNSSTSTSTNKRGKSSLKNRRVKNYKDKDGMISSWREKVIRAWTEYGNLTFAQKVLFQPEFSWLIGTFLFLAEMVIIAFIILYRPYTEIDWNAYMQEVEGFLNGTLDYQYLKGDTGPLVYPAGFVYIFSILYYLTDRGENILRAQWIFGLLYLCLVYQIFKIYSRSRKVPPYALIFLTFTSYRIHSIFVLRLFNDPIAILLTYFAINAFLDGRWTLGSLSYSLAVSIKMNVLLFAPALLTVYLTQLNVFDASVQLVVCGCLQVVLALPFLLVNPISYLSRSFDLGRVFLFEWTVNWKFLPEEYFLSRYFHMLLLVLHLAVLALFLPSWLRYLRANYRLSSMASEVEAKGAREFKAQLILLPLFISNFIGVCFCRSLHYQFYVWYYHTIPYLLWSTKLPVRLKIAVFGIIELCWNVFPANSLSSSSLAVCHLLILVGLFHYGAYQKEWNLRSKKR